MKCRECSQECNAITGVTYETWECRGCKKEFIFSPHHPKMTIDILAGYILSELDKQDTSKEAIKIWTKHILLLAKQKDAI